MRPARAGFTLIEIMAVVVIIGMITALGLPRLSSARWRALGNAAENVAASLEFARQRAIMTGVPHRVLVDLEAGRWRVEWLVSEERAQGGEASTEVLSLPPGPDDARSRDLDAPLDPRAPIALHAPTASALDYHPIASKLGSFSRLDEGDELYFVGLAGPEGWIEGGEIQIVFEADGTTEQVLLELADADDRHLTLKIEPLLDRIRRRDGPARS